MKKQRWEESEEKSRREKIRESEKKEDAGAQKCSKVVKHCVFPMVCGSGGSISRLAKATGAEPCSQTRNEKLNAVARSTFPSQHVQNILRPFLEVETSKKCTPLWRKAHVQVKMRKKTPGSDHFSKLRCRKKWAPLWRQAHFQVKMRKTHQVRNTFWSWHVGKVDAVVVRSTFPSQNVKNTTCSDHFWTFRCRFVWQGQGIVHLDKREQNMQVL